jgi:hypothetical protein
VDGTVISRNIDVGQAVAATLTAPTLFTIAQDLHHMQVHAAVDEADIGGGPRRPERDLHGRCVPRSDLSMPW